jgi:hypothetical protein
MSHKRESPAGGCTPDGANGFVEAERPKLTTVPYLRVVRSDGDNMCVSEEGRSLVTRWRLLLEATRDSRLSRTDCAVLGAIFDRVNRETGECFPKLTTIAKIAKVADRSAPRSIAKLCGIGYLNRTSGNRDRSNRYRWDPIPARNLPDGFVTDELVSDEAVPQSLTNVSGTALTNLSAEPALRSNLSRETTTAPMSQHAQSHVGTADRFDEFWTAYPKKQGSKAKAKATWRKKRLDSSADQIIAHVCARASTDPQWLKDRRQFVPYPTTFLAQDRWEEEWVPIADSRRGAAAFRVSPCGLTVEQANSENARTLARLGGVL